MSIFLGKLKKYYKNQEPIDTLTFGYQFEDPKFPPASMVYSKDDNKNEIFEKIVRNKFNLKKDEPLEIEFITIKDYYENIFDEKINCTKFQQNILGNCYFLDVVSLLSNYGQLLTQIFRIDKINIQGYYEICLFIDGQWQIVIIDDYIPFFNINGDLEYIGCSPAPNVNCCYFMLLEKALAKIKGSYVDTMGGYSGDIFQLLTGFSYKNIFHKEKTKEEIFDFINEKMRNFGYLFCCNSKKELVGEVHAFSVLNAESFANINGEGTINLLQVRNPWGAAVDKEGKTIKSLMTEESKKRLSQNIESFLNDEDNGIMWVDEQNFISNFEYTQCCYSMLGSNVYTFRFTNIEKDRDHNIFIEKEGILIFKLVLNSDERLILSHSFNYKEPNMKFECFDLINNQKYSLNTEFLLKKGKYIIIASFDNIDIKKNYMYLIINLYCLNEVKFDFIRSIKAGQEKNIIYKNVFNGSCETLKRTKFTYKHCEDLRDKFLYHQTLIKFFKEKLGCEFSLLGLGFYLDTFRSDKVECMIRINKNTRAKFKQIVVSQEIKPNKIPSNEICVGTSHINGEIVGRGEVWKIKEVCNDANLEEKLDVKCIFRGEVVKNKQVESKKEKIEDEKTSDFKEEVKLDENEGRTVSEIEILAENKEEGIIKVKSKLKKDNKVENIIKSPLHAHNLYFCITERSHFGGGYYCNICKKGSKCSVPSYYCTLCDFDMCEECTKLTEFLPQSVKGEFYNEGNYWQFKSTGHMHPLTYLSLKKNSKVIKCEDCHCTINPNDYFYFCSGCEYSLCEDCKLRKKRGDPYQLSVLWHEHPLNICLPIIPKTFVKYTCNHCNKDKILEFRFYCTKCDYYLCIECYSKYIFNFRDFDTRNEKNEIEIANNSDKFDFQTKLNMHLHPLTLCIIRQFTENYKYFKCHICHENFNQTDLAYLCSLCDFKYCKKCINKILNNGKKEVK